MFLKIPDYKIVEFDMRKFAEHVLNASKFTTRSQERPILNVISAIVAAKDGVAEIVDGDAKDFQEACQAVEYPKLTLTHIDPSGKPFGEPIEVPRSGFHPFYEAAENMTAERPLPPALGTPEHLDTVILEAEPDADSAAESLPVAAE